jgi:hypothetical protein
MKPVSILLFFSIIGIILSYSGSTILLDDEVMVTAGSYEVLNLGWHPYSKVRVLGVMVSEHESDSRLIEVRVVNKNQLNSFVKENYEEATVYPEKRFFIDGDFDGAFINDLGWTNNFMVINNKIRVVESQTDKTLRLRVDLIQPYAYLRPFGVIVVVASAVILARNRFTTDNNTPPENASD